VENALVFMGFMVGWIDVQCLWFYVWSRKI